MGCTIKGHIFLLCTWGMKEESQDEMGGGGGGAQLLLHLRISQWSWSPDNAMAMTSQLKDRIKVTKNKNNNKQILQTLTRIVIETIKGLLDRKVSHVRFQAT